MVFFIVLQCGDSKKHSRIVVFGDENAHKTNWWKRPTLSSSEGYCGAVFLAAKVRIFNDISKFLGNYFYKKSVKYFNAILAHFIC